MHDLDRTDALHTALRHVSQHQVVFHPGCLGPVEGFAWSGGGQMFQREIEALIALWHKGLVTTEPHGRPPRHLYYRPRKAALTRAGQMALAQWDVEVGTPQGGAA